MKVFLFFILFFSSLSAQTNYVGGIPQPWTVSIGGSGAATLTGLLKGNGTSAFTALTIPLSETNGGTNQSTYTTGNILYASASNTLSKLAIGGTGSSLTVFGGIPIWTDFRFAVTGSDFTTTSGTLTDITGMGFSIAASEVWSCQVIIFGSTSNAVTIQFGVNAPSGATVVGNQQLFSGAGATGVAISAVNTATTAITMNAVARMAMLNFTVVNSSTGGTVQVRVQSSAGGSTVDVPVGSYLIAHRVL